MGYDWSFQCGSASNRNRVPASARISAAHSGAGSTGKAATWPALAPDEEDERSMATDEPMLDG